MSREITDITIAKKYINKVKNAKKDKIEFSLSLLQFAALMKETRCAYTGIELTYQKDHIPQPTDITIDRIDNTKGYVKGNVTAVCFAANNIKSFWENPSKLLTYDHVKKMIRRLDRIEAKKCTKS